MKERIRERLLNTGASAVGFAKAENIKREVQENYAHWINEGNNGEMDYLKRHTPLRQNPESVLSNARTVISLAYSYAPSEWRNPELPVVAAYAFGEDYHYALREILQPVVNTFKEEYGGSWRICIDSAPLEERFWAMKAGIGKRGLNGSIIVEPCGGWCFLVEIITSLQILPDTPSNDFCDKCGLCIKICPGRALKGDGSMDARKCINYLTIEKAGNLSQEELKLVKSGKGYLYGCDLCLRVCPHNKEIFHTGLSRFGISDNIKDLSPEQILKLNKSEFKKQFKESPLLYAGFDKLYRNAQNLQN